jgi:hypothetical protein
MSVLRSRFRFRIRHPWRIVIVGLILAAIGVEAARLITTQAMIDQAAREAARYAVTGEFDPGRCRDGDHCDQTGRLSIDQRQALQDDARLQTIYAVAQLAAGALPADALRIVVCSNRIGYTYDQDTAVCWPRDDAGGPGDEVLIDIGYDYPLGSLLGAGIVNVPLQAMQATLVEHYRTVRIQGLPPTVEAPGGRSFTRLSYSDQIEPTITPANRDQMIVQNGDLQLIVVDADASLAQATAIASDLSGYVVKSEAWSDGATRSARIEMRVPAAQFKAALERLKGLAVRVPRETSTGEDVTEEYVDLESRLKGLQATAARTQALLDKAQTVDEALHVSTELGNLQQQIEQLTGRMNYLQNRVAYSTITIALSPDRPALTTIVWQPGSTADRAINFLGGAGRFAGDAVIWGIIVGVPFAAIAFVVVRLVRRARHTQPTRT